MASIVQEDIVWEVHDNYQKQTFRNRYHICTDQGLHKLSIPIKHVGGSDGRQKYSDVQIENSYPWQLQHWKTLQTAYRTSPFFEFYEDELAPIFEKKYRYLLDFNWDSISFLMEALQLNKQIGKTVKYSKDFTKGKDFRFMVNSKKPFGFSNAPYNQVFGQRHGFVENTSMLDLLFNEGSNASFYLQQQSLNF